MPEGDILHDTAGDCSDKELLTARLPGRNDNSQRFLQYMSCNSERFLQYMSIVQIPRIR